MKECYEAAGKALGVPIDVQTGTTERDTASQLDVLMTMADMDYDLFGLADLVDRLIWLFLLANSSCTRLNTSRGTMAGWLSIINIGEVSLYSFSPFLR